jgi:hypothetical protein
MSKEDKRCTKVDFQRYRNTLEQASLSQQTLSSEQPRQLDRIAHTGVTLNPKKRKSSPRSEHTRKVISGGPKSLGLPQVREEEETSRSLIVREDESPWESYRRTLRCKLAGDVLIAARRSRPSQVVAIREYTKGDKDKMLRLYDYLDHANVLSAQECFVMGETMYARVDDLPLTLEHLVGCRSLYPTETELASMVWQVCRTLCFGCPNLLTEVDSGRSMLPQQLGIRASIAVLPYYPSRPRWCCQDW